MFFELIDYSLSIGDICGQGHSGKSRVTRAANSKDKLNGYIFFDDESS